MCINLDIYTLMCLPFTRGICIFSNKTARRAVLVSSLIIITTCLTLFWQRPYSYVMGAERLEKYKADETIARSGQTEIKLENVYRPNFKQLSYFPKANQHDFPVVVGTDPYIINNDTICKRARNLAFVVLVHSATEHFIQRSNIRRTWGNISLYTDREIRVVFLLGKSKSDLLDAKIKRESSVYNDIVQGSFIDTYHNLTYKVVLGMKWVSENCMNPRMIVKVDDDVFVNIYQLLNDIDIIYKDRAREILCSKKVTGSTAIQRDGAKWSLPWGYFSNMTHYPFDYCNGYFVLITPDIVKPLYEASKVTPRVWIDDVYLFGLVADVIGGVQINNLDTLHIYGFSGMECFKSKTKICNYRAVIMQDPNAFEQIWKDSLINRQLAHVS